MNASSTSQSHECLPEGIDPLAAMSRSDFQAPCPAPNRRLKPPHPISELNLTSMLDVIFQLLIFFMLTASFFVAEGLLPADLAQGQGPNPPPAVPVAQPLVIELASDGETGVRIMIGKQAAANFLDAHKILRAMHVDQGGTRATDDPVELAADDAVRWEHVVNAFNQCARAGFGNIQFKTVE